MDSEDLPAACLWTSTLPSSSVTLFPVTDCVRRQLFGVTPICGVSNIKRKRWTRPKIEFKWFALVGRRVRYVFDGFTQTLNIQTLSNIVGCQVVCGTLNCETLPRPPMRNRMATSSLDLLRFPVLGRSHSSLTCLECVHSVSAPAKQFLSARIRLGLVRQLHV